MAWLAHRITLVSQLRTSTLDTAHKVRVYRPAGRALRLAGAGNTSVQSVVYTTPEA